MSFDVDDVGAVCVAHALADRGAAEIIGIVYDSGYPYGVGAIDALNHYYGRPNIPLGSYKGPFGETVSGRYVSWRCAAMRGPSFFSLARAASRCFCAPSV